MSQDLTAVIPTLLAQGLVSLRQRAIMPRLVSRAFELAPGVRGSTVNVPIASAVPATDVSPGATHAGGTDIHPTSVAVACDQWKEAAFVLSDKEVLESIEGTIPMQANEAIKSLANAVDAHIWSFYKGVYGYVGTAGTTPFAADVTGFTSARKVMARQLTDVDPRYFVMDPDAEANALALAAFRDIGQSGDSGLISDGVIGRKYGATWLMSQNVPTHTAGTITTGLIAKSGTAVAAGLKTLVATTAASTGACALLTGDILAIAGHTTTYAVSAIATQASAASDVTITFTPGLEKALAGSEAITVKGSHVVNMAFHRDAFAFATRPLETTGAGLGNFQSAVDPVSGIVLRLEVERQNKRTRWSYDILYGAQIIRPEFAVRVAG